MSIASLRSESLAVHLITILNVSNMFMDLDRKRK